MESNVESGRTIKDYLAMIKRRRVPMIATGGVLFVVWLIIVMLLPPIYRSSATVLIEEQEIPRDLVASTVTSYADQRLQRIEQRVMTSANLSSLIDEFNLYPDDADRLPRSEIIEKMRSSYSLELQSVDVIDPRSGRPTQAAIYFRISFDYGNPGLAQQVTNRLVTLFLQDNLEDRTDRASETSEFLKDQAQLLTTEIEELEGDLAEFKQRNEGALPQLYSLNMTLLQRTEAEILEVQRQMQSIDERRVFLEAQLSQVSPTQPMMTDDGPILSPALQLQALQSEMARLSTAYGPDHPDVARLRRQIDALRRETGLGPDLASIEQQLARVRSDLSSTTDRYGSEHPDVMRLERQYERLLAQRDEAAQWSPEQDGAALSMVRPADAVERSVNVRGEPGGDVVGQLYRGQAAELLAADGDWYAVRLANGTEGYVSSAFTDVVAQNVANNVEVPNNPTFISLQAQLAALDVEKRSLVDKREVLAAKLQDIERRIVAGPQVEREYSMLMRELDTRRAKFQEIKAKQLFAEDAERLERERKGERFTLAEPPIAPTTPHSPKRLAWLFLGVVISIAGSVGTTAMTESLDNAVYSRRELTAVTGVEPLGSIPFIANERDEEKERRVPWLIVGGGVGAVVLIVLAVHFLYKPLDVLWFTLLRKFGF